MLPYPVLRIGESYFHVTRKSGVYPQQFDKFLKKFIFIQGNRYLDLHPFRILEYAELPIIYLLSRLGGCARERQIVEIIRYVYLVHRFIYHHRFFMTGKYEVHEFHVDAPGGADHDG